MAKPRTAELDRLIGLIERSDTILFIGSGVSAWSGLPTWWGLLDDLCRFLESVGRSAELVRRELQNSDLLLAASFGFDQLSRQERCEFLRGVCLQPNIGPSPLHHAIAALGSRCFVTTNYDTLLEQALRQARAGEYFDVVTPLQQLEVASIVQARADGFVFKPHGDIGSCDSVILTREDYRALHGERRNVLEATRTLLVSRPTIFIGFGLRDPDFLLIRDLLSSTFGTYPPDHYALMPDIIQAEADYWQRHYGIRLVSYPTDPGGVGPERHKSLLRMIEQMVDSRSQVASPVQPDATSRVMLSLARHARRLISTIPDAPDPMPLRLGPPARFNRGEPVSDVRRQWGRDSRTALRSWKGGLVLEGAPGSGKSFTVEQVVRWFAADLEEHCLADPPHRLESLQVPVIIQLRDYRGDVISMAADALPLDVQPEEIFAWGNGAFFLDGVNEIPAEFSLNDVLTDLGSFVDKAVGCTVVLTTRFSEELEPLGMARLSLDEISREYVVTQIAERGISLDILDETIDLLRRPLYFNAWKGGRLDITAATTVHDIYSQLVHGMEVDASSRFGELVYGDIFGKIAYSMIESGDLSLSVAQVHTELRSVLPSSVDMADFVNHQLSTGTLLATPLRRLTFFHHSLAEYFAARYLARLATVDRGAIRRCLSRRDWDQAVLLTLGFLSTEQASVIFDEVMSADPAMALRALNYVETQREEWTGRALTFLAGLTPNRIDIVSEVALSRLRVTPANEASLMALVERGELHGGVAAALLWDTAPGHRPWLLEQLLDSSRGYNFLTRLADGIHEQITEDDARTVLHRLSSISVDVANERRLLYDDEDTPYQEITTAVAKILSRLPVEERIAHASGASVLTRYVIACSLDQIRDPSTVAFMQELILAGDEYAIVRLHFQLTYGKPLDAALPQLLPGIVDALLTAIREGRHSEWAVGALRALVEVMPDLVHPQLSRAVFDPGLMSALGAYVTGDIDLFFEIIAVLSVGNVDWSTEPVEALKNVEVPWADRPEILVNLLRQPDLRLRLSLLTGIGLTYDDDTKLSCHLDDIEWWIELLVHSDGEDDWVSRWRLGDFLALGTDTSTKRDILHRFNEVAEERAILAQYVLPRMLSVSVDDLSAAAIEWLLSEMESRPYVADWEGPPLAKLASEDFIQRRLIPMLLDRPGERLRENLLLTLRHAGGRHRRRYIDEDGSLIG